MKRDLDYLDPIAVGDRVLYTGSEDPKTVTDTREIEGVLHFQLDGEWHVVSKKGSQVSFTKDNVFYFPSLEDVEGAKQRMFDRRLDEVCETRYAQMHDTVRPSQVPPISKPDLEKARKLYRERIEREKAERQKAS